MGVGGPVGQTGMPWRTMGLRCNLICTGPLYSQEVKVVAWIKIVKKINRDSRARLRVDVHGHRYNKPHATVALLGLTIS